MIDEQVLLPQWQRPVDHQKAILSQLMDLLTEHALHTKPDAVLKAAHSAVPAGIAGSQASAAAASTESVSVPRVPLTAAYNSTVAEALVIEMFIFLHQTTYFLTSSQSVALIVQLVLLRFYVQETCLFLSGFLHSFGLF